MLKSQIMIAWRHLTCYNNNQHKNYEKKLLNLINLNKTLPLLYISFSTNIIIVIIIISQNHKHDLNEFRKFNFIT